MNFDFIEVFTRAAKITWKYKVLWIFGILASCGRSSGGSSNSGGNGGGGSGSGGGGPAPVPPVVVVPTPPGQILGDVTVVPSTPQPQVAGAVTELPRTGAPVSALLILLAVLAVVAAPKALSIVKRAE